MTLTYSLPNIEERIDNYVYTLVEKDNQYVKRRSLIDGRETEIFNLNKCHPQECKNLNKFEIYHEYSYMIYTVCSYISNCNTTYIRDLNGNKIVYEIKNTDSVKMTKRNEIYYLKYEGNRANELRKVSIDTGEEITVYKEEKEECYLQLNQTKDHRNVFLIIGSQNAANYGVNKYNSADSRFR